METHRTTGCSRYGHREVTIVIEGDTPIPHLHDGLLRYLESSVADGKQFRPGETIRYGWSKLRLCDRADGTLGVEELELTQEIRWTESVTRALKDSWFQVQVAKSVGLDEALAFPCQDDAILVQLCAAEGEELLLHRLAAEQCPEGFSGWALSCRADHDHAEQEVLPLLAVAATQPGLVQFLALPHETAVLVAWRKRPSTGDRAMLHARIFRRGGAEELVPAPASYLGHLQAYA